MIFLQNVQHPIAATDVVYGEVYLPTSVGVSDSLRLSAPHHWQLSLQVLPICQYAVLQRVSQRRADVLFINF